MVAITTTRYIAMEFVHSCGYFRELSCRFDVARVVFGIPKRVTSLSLRALSADIFVIFRR